MARFDSYEPGSFSWVDLMAKDAERARRFYSALFGWTYTLEEDQQGGHYTMFSSGDAAVAGMGQMNEEMKAGGMPAVWHSYVTVTDLEETTKKCVELGGQVTLPPMVIPDAGAMAILQDPQGAAISLWRPNEHIGSQIANEPVSFCWNELLSREPDASAGFYSKLFDWKIEIDTEAANAYRMISVKDRMNGGILPWAEEMGPIPPNWAVYFAVADCDATVAKCQELGGQLYNGPVDIPPGRFAVLADDQGATFNVMKVNTPD